MRGRAAEYETRYQQARLLVVSMGKGAREASKEAGINLYVFQRRLLKEEGLDVRSERKGNQKPDPTLQEIQERAAFIRSTWTLEEEQRRWVGNHSRSREYRVSRVQRIA
jgi:hypothetical protein